MLNSNLISNHPACPGVKSRLLSGKQLKLIAAAITIAVGMAFITCNSSSDKSSSTNAMGKGEEQEEDHHMGEIGKGPHGGTVEEAEPNHIEMVADGKDLVFYLLDGDAKPVDMKGVTGGINMINKLGNGIQLMEMNGKLTAMGANNGQPFSFVATLTKDGKSYSATFSSDKDLPAQK